MYVAIAQDKYILGNSETSSSVNGFVFRCNFEISGKNLRKLELMSSVDFLYRGTLYQ